MIIMIFYLNPVSNYYYSPVFGLHSAASVIAYPADRWQQYTLAPIPVLALLLLAGMVCLVRWVIDTVQVLCVHSSIRHDMSSAVVSSADHGGIEPIGMYQLGYWFKMQLINYN
jgi:hypothetical protein